MKQTLLPLQSANFLFKILSAQDSEPKGAFRNPAKTSNPLTTTYRRLTTELDLLLSPRWFVPLIARRSSCPNSAIFAELVVKVTSAVAAVVSASPLAHDLQWFTEGVVANAEKLTNMLAYSRDGTLAHLKFDRALWTELVQDQFAASLHEDAITLLQNIYEVSLHH